MSTRGRLCIYVNCWYNGQEEEWWCICKAIGQPSQIKEFTCLLENAKLQTLTTRYVSRWQQLKSHIFPKKRKGNKLGHISYSNLDNINKAIASKLVES